MENIPLPKDIEYKKIKENKTQVIIGPLFPGYGITIANSLRRVLLSSLSGAAVTKVKIKGASHEFSTLKYLKEDVVELILNIKKIRLKVFSEEPIKLKLKIKGEKVVTASDINQNAQMEITNPDLILGHLTDKKAELEIEFTAENGQGYITAENKIEQTLAANEISIDSFYSPIINVSFGVEAVRVGKRTDYEKLKMKVHTDGTITPEEAISKATKVLIDHFSLIYQEEKPVPVKKAKKTAKKKVVKKATKKVAKKPAKKTVKKTTKKK
jgi:DNA-directed RNA polymerase subunit alpha